MQLAMAHYCSTHSIRMTAVLSFSSASPFCGYAAFGKTAIVHVAQFMFLSLYCRIMITHWRSGRFNHSTKPRGESFALLMLCQMHVVFLINLPRDLIHALLLCSYQFEISQQCQQQRNAVRPQLRRGRCEGRGWQRLTLRGPVSFLSYVVPGRLRWL